MSKRILSLLLALGMLLSLLPVQTFAEGDEAPTEQTSVQEPIADETLPPEQPADVQTDIPEEEIQPSVQEETIPAATVPEQILSGETEPAAEPEQETNIQGEETSPRLVITAFAALEADIAEQVYIVGSDASNLILPAAIDAMVDGQWVQLRVSWVPDAAVEDAQDGDVLTYTMILPDGYALADGVVLPAILVQAAGIEAQSDLLGSGMCGENVTWMLDPDGTFTVSGTGAMYNKDSWEWDSLRDRIKVLEIREGVTGVGAYAFAECVNMEEISLSSTLQYIGSSAFSNCNRLTSVTIPEGVTQVQDDTFAGCINLEKVTFPSTLQGIGYGAFNECRRLQGVYITDLSAWCMIHYSSSSPFLYGGKLYCNGQLVTDLVVPQDVTQIGSRAFYGLTSLTSVTMHDGITTLGDDAFGECTNLTSLRLSASLTEIPGSCFSGCDLRELTIPEGVTRIGRYAFYRNNLLALMKLPASLRYIMDGAFGYLTPATIYYGGSEADREKIVIGEYNSGLKAENCIWYYNVTGSIADQPLLGGGTCGPNLTWQLTQDGTLTIEGTGDMDEGWYDAPWYPLRSRITAVSLPHGLRSMNYTFRDCTALTQVEIPNSVTSISGAFSGCTALTQVEIPNSVTSMYSAFSGCRALKNVTVPGSVTEWDDAFSSCTSLENVTLTSGLTRVFSRAFEGCNSLQEIVIPKSVQCIDSYAFSGCSSLRKVTFQPGTYEWFWVSNNAFENCTALTEIDVPGSIGEYVFSGCKNLASAAVSGDIRAHAFDGCVSLKNITIRYGCQEIGTEAFAYCGALETAVVPSSVETVNRYAFRDCTRLSEVYFQGDTAPEIAANSFEGVTATVYYPISSSWNQVAGPGYGGTLTWKRYTQLTYTLRYDANGGTGSMSAQTGLKASVGYHVAANRFTRAGCTFVEWNTMPDGSGRSYLPYQIIAFEPEKSGQTLTLYAQWDAPIYPVIYDLGSEEAVNHPDNPAFCSVAQIPVPLWEPTWVHHTFLGWYTDAAFTNKVTSITKVYSDMIFYAKWEDTRYGVSWMNEDQLIRRDTYLFGQIPAAYDGPAPVKAPDSDYSYTFDGWAAEPSGERITELPPVEGDIAYYARFLCSDRQYRITYLTEGTNASANPETYTRGQGVAELAAPYRPGYLFLGWYTGTNFNQKVEQITPDQTGDIVLLARWVAEKCGVEYVMNDSTAAPAYNSVLNPAVLEAGGASALLEKPARKGYTFDGWYSNGEKITSLAYDDAYSEETYLRVEAQWTAVNYPIVYKNITAEEKAELDAFYTVEGLALTVPERYGETFGGWYWDAQYKKPLTQDESGRWMITPGTIDSRTVYAKWTASQYTIAFEANSPEEGVLPAGTMRPMEKRLCGKAYTLPGVGFKCSGYVFQSWNTEPNGTGSSYANKASVRDLTDQNGGVVTLYAQWAANGDAYGIDFDANGGEGTLSSLSGCLYGKAVALPSASGKLTRAGYNFGGWNTEPDGSGVSYKNGARVTNACMDSGNQVTLYAQWMPVTYKITYVLNLGKNAPGNPAAYTVESGLLELEAPERAGHTFIGWYTSGSFEEDTAVNFVDSSEAKAVKLFARWQKNTYAVILEGNGADNDGAMEALECVYGKKSTLTPNAYVREGYTFTGWNTESDGSGKRYGDRSSVLNLTFLDGEEITLFAQWQKNVFLIRFDANSPEAQGLTDPTLGTYGKYVRLSNNGFAWEGRTFLGWNTQPDGTGQSYKMNALARMSAGEEDQITLYAQWAANSYCLLLDANDASGRSTTAEGYSFDTAKKLPKFTDSVSREKMFSRPGYNFVGWNTRPDGSGKAYKDGASVKALSTDGAEVVTLYAQWEAVTYQISYTLNGGVNPSSVPKTFRASTDYATTQKLPVPTKVGYTFLGWFTPAGDKVEILPAIPASGTTLKLIARWG